MTQKFLAIGECMIEMSMRHSGDYAMSFAGDTFNTAWYLRRVADADLTVAFLSAVGDDSLSQQMRDFIHASGIVPELEIIPERTVGLYMISLHNGERSFQYWRSASAARCLARNLQPLTDLGTGDMAYFSGITLAILRPVDRELVLSALADARKSGVTVVLDTNLRPRLWNDLQEMRDWVMRAAAVADIVLPSFDDEAACFHDVDKHAVLLRYRHAGASCVIVKDGPGTVLFQGRNGAETAFTPERHPAPVDTTAAGDSFNAAFLAAYLRGEELGSAVAAGCALSYKVVAQKGALVSL